MGEILVMGLRAMTLTEIENAAGRTLSAEGVGRGATPSSRRGAAP